MEPDETNEPRRRAIDHLHKGASYAQRWLDGWQGHLAEVTRVSEGLLEGRYKTGSDLVQEATALSVSFYVASWGWLMDPPPRAEPADDDDEQP